jgi:DNA-binding XRE family transcriptional regulator
MTETVTIPRSAYDALLSRITDLEDALAADRARREGPPLPAAFAWRIADGENPVRVWREYRGEGLRQLAERAGIAPGFLSEIENGRKSGGVATLKAVAAALDTTVDWLIL